MINYGFPPQDNWRGPKLYSFEGHTPSLVTGSPKAFESILNIFLNVAKNRDKGIVIVNDKNHTSDMIILSEHRSEFIDLNYPAHLRHDNPAINDSVLIHFSAGDSEAFSGGKMSKTQLARNFRKGNT